MMRLLKTRLRLPAAMQSTAAAITTELQDFPGMPEAYLYATVDLAMVEEVDTWLESLRCQGGRNLFASHPEAEAESLAAWLLPLGQSQAIDASRLACSVAQALLSDSVTWLASTLPLDQMASRLSRRLTARLAEGEALFRCYDPRLLPVIYEAWAETPLHPFFALGERWHFLDASFQLRHVALSAAAAQDAFSPPLPVSEAQHRYLQSVSELHQMERLLGLRKPEQFFRIAPGHRRAFVASQRDSAAACGVVVFAEVLRYCELAMEHGEEFHRQPRWQAVWHAMRSTGARLSDAISLTQTQAH